jgi:WD40 repeat protein
MQMLYSSLSLKGHEGCVNALALYDSCKYLISGSIDQTIIIWEIWNNFKLTEQLRGHHDAINSLTVLDFNIVSASTDKTVRIWSKHSIYIEKVSAHSDLINTICYLQNGLIATGSFDNEIKIWKQDNSNSLELITTLTEHVGAIYSLTELNNGILISGSTDCTARIWSKINETSFVYVRSLQFSYAVTSLAVLEDLLIIANEQGCLYIYDQNTFQLLNHNQSPIFSIAVLNNQTFASASHDSTIKIWKREDENIVFSCNQTLKHSSIHQEEVFSINLIFLKDDRLVSSGSDTKIKVWKQNTFFLLKTLEGHSDSITGLAVLENGNFISVSLDKTIIIWDSETLTKIKFLTETSDIWSVIAFSNDLFVTGNGKGDLKVWSYSLEHKLIKTLTDHSSSVLDLAVLNNGHLVSASQNGSIRLWDKSFKSYKTEKAHSKAVLALKVSSNGSLISSSEDKTIKTWNTNRYILERNIP